MRIRYFNHRTRYQGSRWRCRKLHHIHIISGRLGGEKSTVLTTTINADNSQQSLEDTAETFTGKETSGDGLKSRNGISTRQK